MMLVYWLIRDKILSFVGEEDGADAVEYFLTIGGISVAVVGALVALIWGNFAGALQTWM